MKTVGFFGTSVSYLSTSLDGIASLGEALSSLVPSPMVRRQTVTLLLFHSLVDVPQASWSCILAHSAVWKFGFISEVILQPVTKIEPEIYQNNRKNWKHEVKQ